MIVDIIYGFLGSGKTTFIINALKELNEAEKTVVLVNEFGDVGIDGGLLEKQGGNVVEMPSGCICCTLQTDFRSQLLELTQNIRPERVIIEPTGVATIKQIQSIVGAQLFENFIEKIHSVMIADASGFMELFKANPHFTESQTRNADLVLLNKCDRVNKKKAQVIRSAISAINPNAAIMMTEYGAVDWADYRQALSAASSQIFSQHLENHSDDHNHEGDDELGYKSFGCIYNKESFEGKSLETFFQRLNSPESDMGDIVRAKGIFRIGSKWKLIEIASGEISSQPVKQSDQSKVTIIGNDLNSERITESLNRCMRTD